jgi:hypothetical protein
MIWSISNACLHRHFVTLLYCPAEPLSPKTSSDLPLEKRWKATVARAT